MESLKDTLTVRQQLSRHRRLFCLPLLILGSFGAPLAAQKLQRDPERLTAKRTVTWRGYRDMHVVKQRRDYSCGAAALATVTRYYWLDRSANELDYLQTIEQMLTPQELQDRVQRGLSMTDLRRLAVKKGYVASIGRVELQKLYELKVPVVVAIRVRDYDHFVVFKGIRCGQVHLADPSRGNIRLPVRQFACQWIDKALLVVLEKGKTTSESACLGIRCRDVRRGWLNEHVARTAPERIHISAPVTLP